MEIYLNLKIDFAKNKKQTNLYCTVFCLELYEHVKWTLSNLMLSLFVKFQETMFLLLSVGMVTDKTYKWSRDQEYLLTWSSPSLNNGIVFTCLSDLIKLNRMLRKDEYI